MRWRPRNTTELRHVLEDYTALEQDQYVPGDGGDEVGEVTKQDRLGRLMAQNRAIDAGMRRLFWGGERAAWRLLRQYYLSGAWAERGGWVIPARSAGVPVPACLRYQRCYLPGDDLQDRGFCSNGGQECERHYARFEEASAAAIAALFDALSVRSEGTS